MAVAVPKRVGPQQRLEERGPEILAGSHRTGGTDHYATEISNPLPISFRGACTRRRTRTSIQIGPLGVAVQKRVGPCHRCE